MRGNPELGKLLRGWSVRGVALRRLWTRLGCLVAVLALAVSAAATAAPVHRIVAVGDLHGDFAAWRDIARAAKLIDGRGAWIGGNAVLVQTGDVVDRGPDSLKIIQDLMRLQREAQRARGQVIALVGNHEAMNVIGDLRYVSAGEYAAFTDRSSAQRREAVYTANKDVIEAAYRQQNPELTSEAIKQAWIEATPLGVLEHQAAWRAEGVIGRWIVSNPAVALVDGTLFVHGGISPAYAGRTIEDINRQIGAALMAQSETERAILNDPLGPLWYRGLADEGAAPATEEPGAPAASEPAPPIETQLETLLPAYGARRIVIGHTPSISGIGVLYGGRLIRIDTGISAVYGGKVSYLEILDGTPIPHVVERSHR